MFSSAPLTSLSARPPPVDPDPVASFRHLIAVPPDTTLTWIRAGCARWSIAVSLDTRLPKLLEAGQEARA
jgi:hypothetical protein